MRGAPLLDLCRARTAQGDRRSNKDWARGFRVLRFWNDEVPRELDSVWDTIIAFARDQSLRPRR